MKKSNTKIASILLSSSLILNLIILYYIKYSNQNLSISDFSFTNLGNIFNLVLIIILIFGILTCLKKNKLNRTSIIFFILILFLSLFIAYLTTLFEFSPFDAYIFGQPGDKFFDAAFFTLYQFILFTFISFVWLKVLGPGKSTLLRSLFNGVIMLIFFLVLTFIFIQTKGYNSDSWVLVKSKKNVIVVLGAAVWSDNKPSPSLSGRVDRAIELFNEGYAGTVILTGGSAPGELSEAEVAYNYAKKEGMDMTYVGIETLSTSTIEQILYIRRSLLNDKNIEDVIVVSDSYHLIRVLEVSKFFDVDIKVTASKQQLDYEENIYRQLRESIALVVFWGFAL